MKLLLIYPSFFPGGTGAEFPSPPLAIYSLAGMAKSVGVDVTVVDPSRYGLRVRQRDTVEELVQGCDTVGISSNSLTWHEALRLIENIKAIDDGIRIIVGGVHATYFDCHILECSRADYVVRGEAEHAFPRLLRALEQGQAPRDIPGISYRAGDGGIVRNPGAQPVGLGNGVPPLYEAIPDGVYKLFPLETSRGCPNACFFCSVPYRRRWRPKAPTQVLEELEWINRSYIHKTTTNAIVLVDDCFTASQAHVKAICQGIRERGFRNSFVLEARIMDLLKGSVLDDLAGLDLRTIQVGVECGYDEGLQKVRKGDLTVSKVIECAKRLREKGVVDKVMFSFILGLPWEGEAECFRTLEFAEELVSRYGGYVNFSWWLLFPSDGWEERHAYGIDLDSEIFDIQDWVTLEDLFQRMHPRLRQDSVRNIKRKVEDLRQLVLGSFFSTRTFRPALGSIAFQGGAWNTV
jgi:radical SAM superfamily enzyme YgiQ (UPF0313 family)